MFWKRRTSRGLDGSSDKDVTRRAPILGCLEQFVQDLAFGARSFARTPGFTAVVVLTLALGIGATTAMFSIVNALLLHPLPYRDPDRLVVIWERLPGDPKAPPVFDSYRDFHAWESRSQSFEQLAAATWATGGQILTGSGPAREVLAMPAGIEFFSMLGVAPELGRAFQTDDLKRGCTVVLHHRFWMSAFGGQNSAIGRHIELNQKACTVVGVMPKGFTFYPDVLAMWMLITPDSEISRDPDNANVGVFGRLKPGVSLERAQREMQILYANEHRKDTGGVQRVVEVYPLAKQFAYLTGPNLRLSIVVLFGAVIFVLLIACFNIANLLLGRSLVRQKELAVRAALGSGRLRLIRQLLTESLLLALAGALAGTLLAVCAVHYFRVLNPIELPPGNPVGVNLFVLGFTAALAILIALLFGLAPALKASRVDVIDTLRTHGRSASSPAARTLGKLLVAGEVMLSLALLVGAGLLIASVNRLASVPLGFRTDHVLTVSVSLPKWSYSKGARRAAFYRELVNRIGALPGVESTALVSSLPLNNSRFAGSALAVDGRPAPNRASAPRDVGEASITPNYFQVLDVALERGDHSRTRTRRRLNRLRSSTMRSSGSIFLMRIPLAGTSRWASQGLVGHG